MNARERIGKRIAELRKEKHLSQVDLAKLTDIDSGHIARIELGKFSAGIDILTRIGLKLGVRLELVETETPDDEPP